MPVVADVVLDTVKLQRRSLAGEKDPGGGEREPTEAALNEEVCCEGVSGLVNAAASKWGGVLLILLFPLARRRKASRFR